jgi:hypothetical protein
MERPETLKIHATDVTGQKNWNAEEVPVNSTISDMIGTLVPKLGLLNTDFEGRPLTYHALLEREGRHLNGSEIVQEALREADRIVLQPNVDAGAHP